MNILDKTWYSLRPTRSYVRRDLEWMPGDVPGEGFAIVTLWKGRRVERDLYQVMRSQEQPGAMATEYLWLNRGDAEQPDVYRVLVGPNLCTCTCKAGKCKVDVCKHRSATTLLIEEREI